MDPISLTATVVSLTARCVQTIKALHELKEKISNARLIVSAVCTEATIISTSLSQLQSLMLSNQDGIGSKLADRPELLSTFDTALTGLMVVFDVLEDEVRKRYRVGGPNASDANLLFRFKVVWHESTMQDLLGQLRGLQGALTLLISLIGTDSMLDLRHRIEQNTTVLQQVAKQTKLIRSKSVSTSRTPASIFEVAFDTQSVYHRDDESYRGTRFDFDYDVLQSTAYRRAREGEPVISNRPMSAQGTYTPVKTVLPLRTNWPSPQGFAELDGSANTSSGVNQSIHHTTRVSSNEHGEPQTLEDLTTKLESLQSRYSKVKRYYFDREADVASLTESLTSLTSSVVQVDKLLLTRRSLVHYDPSLLDHPKFEAEWPEVLLSSLLKVLIESECAHLQSLQTFEYLYKQRLFYEGTTSISPHHEIDSIPSLASEHFGVTTSLHHLNKMFLYDAMCAQKLEQVTIQDISSIFERWRKEVSKQYIQYAEQLPTHEAAIQQAIAADEGLAAFIERTTACAISNHVTWNEMLIRPIVHLKDYARHLSDFGNAFHPDESSETLERILKLRDELQAFAESIDSELQSSRTRLLEMKRNQKVRSLVQAVGEDPGEDFKIIFEAILEEMTIPTQESLWYCVLEPSNSEEGYRRQFLFRIRADTNLPDSIRAEIHTVLGCGRGHNDDSPGYSLWLLYLEGNDRKLIDLVAPTADIRTACIKELQNA